MSEMTALTVCSICVLPVPASPTHAGHRSRLLRMCKRGFLLLPRKPGQRRQTFGSASTNGSEFPLPVLRELQHRDFIAQDRFRGGHHLPPACFGNHFGCCAISATSSGNTEPTP